MKFILFFAAIVTLSFNVSAQYRETNNLDSLKVLLSKSSILEREVDYTSLSFIGAATAISAISLHNYQYKSWWKERSSSFSFRNNWSKYSWMDKAGKFYSTNLIAHFYSAGFEGVGIEYEKATIYSAIIGFGYGFYVEAFDGFTKNEGLNPGDLLFNLIGAGYVLGQYYLPELKNFQPRFSYVPSNTFKDNKSNLKNIFDDYNGQKYWIGIRIREYLPEFVKNFWPSFLMISVGMGVDKGNKASKSSFYFALDLDAEKIPLYGSFWQFVKNTLNYFHFPMPGIRITPNTAGFLFCY